MMSSGHHEVKENDGGLDDCASKGAEECVDPRVQIELERLNAATDLINKLEIELDEARSNFRLLLSESSQHVNQLGKKLGSCVEKARPYYEARMQAKQLQVRTQKAALRYERASSAHTAAKEMVYLAEEGLKKEGRCFDPAWQEMLNHATMRVNEAESERILSQRDHQHTSLAYNEAEKNVQQLHQELKRAIGKSSLSTRRSLLQLNNLANQHQLQLLPYFEMKAHFNQLLEEQRRKVHHLEENVLKVKLSYSDALHNLEEISDEIHQKRQQQDGLNNERSDGVGADSPELLGHNFIKMAHYQIRDRKEDLYCDNCNIEDAYKSLPTKLSSRTSLLACSTTDYCSEVEHEWKSSKLPIVFQDLQLEDSIIPNTVQNYTTEDAGSCSAEVVKGNVSSNINKNTKGVSSSLAKPMQQVTLKAGEIDRSPEGAEIPDAKHHLVDLNILRVQKDLSDSESLASNDTTDTLDDNQIECLLLDRVLPSDYQDTNSAVELMFTNNDQQ